MIKRWMLFLLIAVPVLAQDWTVDTLDYDGNFGTTLESAFAKSLNANIMLTDAVAGSFGDSLNVTHFWGHEDHSDTIIWYISEIGKRCDTSYKKIYAATQLPGAHNAIYTPDSLINYFKLVYERTIKCRADTTWAEKVSVRLRPSELERLMEIITGL